MFISFYFSVAGKFNFGCTGACSGPVAMSVGMSLALLVLEVVAVISQNERTDPGGIPILEKEGKM